MPVRITAKAEGFRRCGIEHACKPVTWPDGRFTPQQLKQLQAESMLIVEVIGPDMVIQPLALAVHLPDTADGLQSLYDEVKQRLLALGAEPEPVPTLESLIEQADFATLQGLRHTLNAHLVGSGEVPELLALRDDINQELQALGYNDPAAPATVTDGTGVGSGESGAGDSAAADGSDAGGADSAEATPPASVKPVSTTAKTGRKGK